MVKKAFITGEILPDTSGENLYKSANTLRLLSMPWVVGLQKSFVIAGVSTLSISGRTLHRGNRRRFVTMSRVSWTRDINKAMKVVEEEGHRILPGLPDTRTGAVHIRCQPHRGGGGGW